MKTQFFSVGLLLCGSIVAAADTCPAAFDDTRHKATDAYKHSFSYQGSFQDYLAAMRNLIRDHNPHAKTTLDGSRSVLDAISPFELQPTAPCLASTARRGMLLIHGLTDTPYLLHELGEHFAKQCFLVRSILLPGHGTVPGDLINVDYAQWVTATNYGVQSLAETADEIYLVGFSTGGALALDYAFGQDAPGNAAASREKIKGLILLAPAIKLKNQWAWVADEKLWFNRHVLNREE